jgi:3-oxoadipate enol-lactonase
MVHALHHREAGSGRPLVLIHGFPFDSGMWQAQLDGLRGRFRVIAPDLPGFGDSRPSRPFTVASAAADVRRLLADLGALPCLLGGLSMGGYVCLELIAQFPADVTGLVLCDTRADADSPEARQNRNRLIALAQSHGAGAIADAMEPKLLAPGTAPDVRRSVRQMMETVPPATLVHCLAALRDRADSTNRLRAFRVPTLVVLGEQDAITPRDAAEALVRGIPTAALRLIPGAGHMPPVEQPAAFNQTLLDWATGNRA